MLVSILLPFLPAFSCDQRMPCNFIEDVEKKFGKSMSMNAEEWEKFSKNTFDDWKNFVEIYAKSLEEKNGGNCTPTMCTTWAICMEYLGRQENFTRDEISYTEERGGLWYLNYDKTNEKAVHHTFRNVVEWAKKKYPAKTGNLLEDIEKKFGKSTLMNDEEWAEFSKITPNDWKNFVEKYAKFLEGRYGCNGIPTMCSSWAVCMEYLERQKNFTSDEISYTKQRGGSWNFEYDKVEDKEIQHSLRDVVDWAKKNYPIES